MENNIPQIGDKVLIDDFVYGVVRESGKPLKDGYVLVHIPHQENASISGGRFLIEIKRLKVNNALSFMRSPSGIGRYYI